MVYLGFQSGLGFLQSILHGLAGLYEDNLFLDQFLSLPGPEAGDPGAGPPPPASSRITQGVTFEGVSFTYPGSDAAGA